MAPKNVILTLLALCGVAFGQTRSLLVDTSGIVQYTNTVQWQGALSFGTNEAAQATTRSNLSLGLPALTNSTGAGLLADIGGLATNGSAAGLTNFPALVLQTNSAESAFPQALLRTNGEAAGLSNFPAIVLLTNSSLSDFPQGLLRTNGDGSGLTNLPNANLTNATGVLPLSNGGTGSTNESAARAALGLGSAATNDASAFQPASTALTNLAAGDASGLTNLPNANLGTATGVLGIANGGSAATNADGARTNFGLVWSGLTNTDAAGFRTALSLGTAATNDATAFQPASTNLNALANNNGGALTNVVVDLTAVLPAYSNNVGKVLAVASGETNVEWTAISNTVTDASLLTNFPSIILQTNSADGSFPAFLLRTNGSAAGLTGFPTLNQNTTGTASNVTGVVAITNGGSGQTTAAAAIEAFLPSYSGNADRILALNSNATGLVWATNAGGGGLPETPLAISNGGTAATTASGALTNLTLLRSNSVTVLGQGATGSNGGAAIGNSANASGADSIAILGNATNAGSIAIGNSSSSTGQYGISIGYSAVSGAGGRNIAIGLQASVATGSTNNIAIGHDANTSQSNAIAIGYLARALTNAAVAIGAAADADAVDSVGVGTQADISATATNSVQLGRGTNSTANSIQFRSAGTVDTTEWGYLANASTKGGSRMTNTNGVTVTNTIIGYDGTNYTTNTITVIDGIITGWTQ